MAQEDWSLRHEDGSVWNHFTSLQRQSKSWGKGLQIKRLGMRVRHCTTDAYCFLRRSSKEIFFVVGESYFTQTVCQTLFLSMCDAYHSSMAQEDWSLRHEERGATSLHFTTARAGVKGKQIKRLLMLERCGTSQRTTAGRGNLHSSQRVIAVKEDR